MLFPRSVRDLLLDVVRELTSRTQLSRDEPGIPV